MNITLIFISNGYRIITAENSNHHFLVKTQLVSGKNVKTDIFIYFLSLRNNK